MCFGAEFLFWLAFKIIFIVFVVMLLRIWVLPKMGDPRWAATVQAFMWFLGACLVVYVLWIIYECVPFGPAFPSHR